MFANHRTGETSLHYAIRAGKAEFVRLLLEAGSNPAAPSERGTPLEAANRYNNKEIIQMISGSFFCDSFNASYSFKETCSSPSAALLFCDNTTRQTEKSSKHFPLPFIYLVSNTYSHLS